jgi:hypothetical protein
MARILLAVSNATFESFSFGWLLGIYFKTPTHTHFSSQSLKSSNWLTNRKQHFVFCVWWVCDSLLVTRDVVTRLSHLVETKLVAHEKRNKEVTARARTHNKHTHTYIHIHTHTYIQVLLWSDIFWVRQIIEIEPHNIFFFLCGLFFQLITVQCFLWSSDPLKVPWQ